MDLYVTEFCMRPYMAFKKQEVLHNKYPQNIIWGTMCCVQYMIWGSKINIKTIKCTQLKVI